MDIQQNNNIQLPEEEGIDIKKYIFLILSHWWWFAIALFVSLTIAYMVNRYSQEIYSANCSIIIGEPQSSVGSIDNILDELARFRGQKRKAVVENEITILKSYKMARLAIEELNFNIEYVGVGRRGIAETRLYSDCPFYVELDTGRFTSNGVPINIRILNKNEYFLSVDEPYNKSKKLKFGEYYEHENFNFRILLRDPENYRLNYWSSSNIYFIVRDLNDLAKQYSNALDVAVNDEKGSILTLNLSGFVPEQIADYLNKLSEVYIRSNLEEKNITSENTIKFIDEQLQGIIDSLEITGLRLQNFRSENKVIDLSKEGSFLLNQLQSLQSEKVTLDMNDRYYRYLLEYIDKKADFSDVVAPSVVGIQDELLNSLIRSLNELNLQKRNLDFNIQESSPQNTQIINRISDTRNALRENLKNLVENNQVAQQAINERITKIDREVQKLPGTERQLINIQRKFTINDQIYTFLLQKRAEAGITKASNISNHTKLDIARAENALLVKPKTSMNYLIALALGGVLPLILLLIIEFFNTKIIDRKYLESNLKVPIIANIGHNDDQTDLPVNEKPGSSMAESFRALRTNMQYILKDPDAKVIAISSAVSGEGKTFCSVNLATIFAMAGRKTLLVNLDLRRPKIHRIFNLPNEAGISTFLIGKNSFDDTIKATNINNLSVSIAGPIPPNPAELIDSEKMKEFIEKAKAIFDYIIIDTPPIAIVSDTMTLKNLIDSFIFVIRYNFSDKQVVDLVNYVASSKMLSNIGVIINDIQISGYYGYSYRYEYGYSYAYSHDYYTDKVEDKGFIRKLFKKI